MNISAMWMGEMNMNIGSYISVYTYEKYDIYQERVYSHHDIRLEWLMVDDHMFCYE